MNKTPIVEIYETWQGWQVRQKTDAGRWQYVNKVYKGLYTYSYDYLYAKSFTKRTAMKHKKILEGRSRWTNK